MGVVQAKTSATGCIRWLPGVATLRTYEAGWLVRDLGAGLVLTTALAPVGIAYAVASGLRTVPSATPSVRAIWRFETAGCSSLMRWTIFFRSSAIALNWSSRMLSGRELLGFPKKLATFDLDSSEARFIGAMERHGVRVLRVEFEQQNILFSLPLPANERVVPPAPYDQILALPDPTGEPHGLPFEVLTTRFIADTIRPQHIASLWKWETGTVWGGKGGVEYASSDADPLAKLPVADTRG